MMGGTERGKRAAYVREATYQSFERIHEKRIKKGEKNLTAR